LAAILSEREEVVLTLIGQQTHEWLNSGNSATVIQAAATKRYPEEDVQLAIELLARKGYLKVSFRSFLQLTADGYYAYAGANVPDFADLLQRVDMELCKNQHTSNDEVIRNLQADPTAINYIFDMLCQNGTIDNGNHGVPLAGGGPHWHIMTLSPEFRIKCREMQP